jgi:hypothetical protein
MTTPEKIVKVDAHPAKDFFVRMLTRDIELHDAILDLLDNCIDGILRSDKPASDDPKPFKGYWAKITFSENKFSIEDNCGGIPWAIAKEYAFKMGKSEDEHRPERSIGLVGIGMKRALFKLGMDSLVHSYHKKDSFEVHVPPSWFSNDLWEFPAQREEPRLDDYGTIIEVNKLHENIASLLAEGKKSAFQQTILRAISLHYCYLLAKGFEVTVNGESATPNLVRILCHKELRKDIVRPYVYKALIGGVEVFLAIGYTQPKPTETQQDAANEGRYVTEDAGWTIVCNDRVVLANNKDRLTGWGEAGVPNYHTQFIGIRGIVEFRCEDSMKLPVTTTKRGIDANSRLYLKIRERMQFALKRFTGNTNLWKGREREHKELLAGADPLGLTELKYLFTGRNSVITLTSLPGTVGESHYVPDLPAWKQPKTHRTISFSKPIRDIERVSVYLFGNDRHSGADVGTACFDRTLKEAKK